MPICLVERIRREPYSYEVPRQRDHFSVSIQAVDRRRKRPKVPAEIFADREDHRLGRSLDLRGSKPQLVDTERYDDNLLLAYSIGDEFVSLRAAKANDSRRTRERCVNEGTPWSTGASIDLIEAIVQNDDRKAPAPSRQRKECGKAGDDDVCPVKLKGQRELTQRPSGTPERPLKLALE